MNGRIPTLPNLLTSFVSNARPSLYLFLPRRTPLLTHSRSNTTSTSPFPQIPPHDKHGIPLPRAVRPLPPTASSKNPQPLSQSEALTLLKSQPSHYVVALLLGKRYILTPNDVLTVHRIRDVQAGDIIRLTRILELGSRDYTLRSPQPELTKEMFSKDWQRRPDGLGKGLGKETVRVECRVLEHGVSKEMIVEKFRRRKRYRRRLLARNMYTKLLVTRLEIGNGVDVIE